MSYHFRYDQRLGVFIPDLDRYWEEYSKEEQANILHEWEKHRSDMPARVKEIEQKIEHKQSQLNVEEDFERSCRLNDEITDLANAIHELNIWFSIQQDTKPKVHR